MEHSANRPASSLTESLGVRGWRHLDPILLAALATGSPLLLIGPHGTAKSMLVERVATALRLAFRHYNASLLNYDDLVGIPLPEEGGAQLRFVSTPGSVWEAEFVFFDEISRCRSDLQNKLFPVIHERRVAGMNLPRLRHCWSAMNPPASDDPDAPEQPGELYFGSEPLDPALVDRFPFVVQVPAWNTLSREDRIRIVAGEDSRGDSGRADPACQTPTLPALVAACAAQFRAVEAAFAARLPEYIVTLLDHLEAARLPQSPRRARMLARSLAAVHAARLVLEGPAVEAEHSARMALFSGLPQVATDTPPSLAALVSAHRQAWEVSALEAGDTMRQVFEETDPVNRVALADRLGLDDARLSSLVTQALASQAADAERLGLATALFLSFSSRRDLSAAAWEPLAALARRVLTPAEFDARIGPGRDLENWREINTHIHGLENQNQPGWELRQNYLLSGFPEAWRSCAWQVGLQRFENFLTLFKISDEGRAVA